MSFGDFNKRLMENLLDLSAFASTDYLFVVDVSGDELWETYLESFPPGTNEVFRKRREHDCSCCRSFIKQFGAVVAIVNNRVRSIWEFDARDAKYQPVIDALDALVVSRPVVDAYVTKEAKHGTRYSNELLFGTDGVNVRRWHHFYVELPAKFVTVSRRSESSIAAQLRTSKEILKRSLDEIKRDSTDTVLDLIAESSLYKGAEWLGPLRAFRTMQIEYEVVKDKDLYCWVKSREIGPMLSRIRNHSIGVLLQDVAGGMDVLNAVKRYERIVAPENYKRPKEIYTKRMVENAWAQIEELGLVDSLPRRFARLTDVTVNNVLFADRDAVRAMTQGGILEQLLQGATQNRKALRGVQAIEADEFLQDVLPATTSLEVLLENTHARNMVSLIAPVNPDAPSILKWFNGFSWAYAGNLADSTMKQHVVDAGGKVTGALRFSIQWNEENRNHNDFDAHCIEPDGRRIYYAKKRGYTGELDVDVIHPKEVAVENIIITKPVDGLYKFLVKNYTQRDGDNGFRAELEFGDQIYEFDYPHYIAHKVRIPVATVQYWDGAFKILKSLTSNTASRSIWGLDTQQFHRVSLVTYSPNFWDANDSTGHRHVFFMLVGAVNDEQPNGFYNEYLHEQYLKHKRVFAALGSKMRVSPDDEQLSGVGFSTTRRGSVIVRVNGNRMFNVLF